MYLISADHLPLSKVIISNCFGCTTANDLSSVLTHSILRYIRCNVLCVKTDQMSWTSHYREKLLITTYQEVNDQHWSNTCCDDENVRASGTTDLPEQHFYQLEEKCVPIPITLSLSLSIYTSTQTKYYCWTMFGLSKCAVHVLFCERKTSVFSEQFNLILIIWKNCIREWNYYFSYYQIWWDHSFEDSIFKILLIVYDEQSY